MRAMNTPAAQVYQLHIYCTCFAIALQRCIVRCVTVVISCGSFQIKMAPIRVKLADLLGKRKEAEVLMNYQKTKNSRDKKKMEERAARKREASKLKYLEKSKDKVKCLESIVHNSNKLIKQKKSEMEVRAAQIAREEEKIAWAKAKIEEENGKVEKPKKKNQLKK